MLGQRLLWLIMMSLLSGFVGGVISAFLFGSGYVVAQPASTDASKTTDVATQKTINAQEFRLVDSPGPCTSPVGVRRKWTTLLTHAG